MIDDDVMARYRERMTVLAESFPTLVHADGVRPWNVDRFESWLQSGAPGHGARCAGRFVLSVWNPYHGWCNENFDLHEALGCWDDPHRAAFAAWVRAPWWP